ncbi:MAG TPA: FHA domain-containing protein [Ktedonobacterales bacterium]
MASEEQLEPAYLQFVGGPLAGQTVSADRPAMTIGRDLGNDIVVKSDLQVSRRHARLMWTDGGWRIENISRGNSMLVNGELAESAVLSGGETVTLGENTAFIWLPPDASAATRIARPTVMSQDATPPDPQEAMLVTAPPSRPLTEATMLERVSPMEPTQVAQLEKRATPTLEITSNTRSVRQDYPLIASSISIGRDSANDIAINDRIVSSRHLQIIRDGDQFTLVHPHPDRPSTLNGLLYQGRKIRGDEQFRKVLAAGDIFRIGDENGTLVTLTFHDGTDAESAGLSHIEPIKLGAQELTIGRAPDNTIVLAHPQVSAHHARLTHEGATYRITDLNSTNHVYVNGTISASSPLRTGDEIRIGPYRLLYEGNLLKPYDESSFIRIDALGLKKQGANGVTLLDDITLSIPPRSFVALVGGSGAGKSTLLDALNGLRPAQSGKVLFNGQDYYNHLSIFASQVGYVPQDDIVHRDLTVERALYYAARLRLPRDFTEDQIAQRINEVLDEVELSHRRTLMVRDLSGGQRKRVSIALELLANPSVFFLDEPTSGLDPGLDRKMMFLLRRLADRGHTIVLVTHATNNINSCDFVCFLSAGGRLAFFGPPEEAKTYFGKTDFAEIYTSLEPTDELPAIPAEAQSRFRASPEYARYIASPTHAAQASPRGRSPTEPASARQMTRASGKGWSQFLVLTRRYLELLRNDRVNLLILLLQAPVIALLLVVMLHFEIGGGIFNSNAITLCQTQIATATGPVSLPQAAHGPFTDCQNAVDFLRNAATGQAYARTHGGVNKALQDFLTLGPGTNAQKALFIMAFATILFGCINGAREFVKEAPIYRRERAVNLGVLPYMFSKIVALGALCLFQSAALLLIIEVGEPLKQGIMMSPLLEAYITLALTSVSGLMLGLAISAVAPNTDRAISFVPIILLPQVIFSGAIIALKDWGSQIVGVVFPSRWAMAALGTTVGLHAETIGGDQLFGSDPTYHGTLFSIYTRVDAINRLMLSWSALAAITVVLIIAIAVFLKRKDIQR